MILVSILHRLLVLHHPAQVRYEAWRRRGCKLECRSRLRDGASEGFMPSGTIHQDVRFVGPQNDLQDCTQNAADPCNFLSATLKLCLFLVQLYHVVLDDAAAAS
ncbi:hypothetical protein E2C01_017569 [Portunus trituberculatus]|uniref:Uncharacterized protein n=1 Tax=Portunus trituberculatus TaxID=210409 RepID=A0A5B7DSV5_PORTR|nr:hypothetical protein [Portunus trituberculatus]